MESKKIRIVYIGTPDFAVEPLKKLVEGGYNVVAVVTMPDKPAGRGHHLQMSAVKEYALSAGLPVLQPEKLKDEAWLEQLRSYKADLQIVVAFRMLPEVVWGMPKMGTFNLHASLLPEYRGAAPINWAVINGEKRTGITTFFLQHEIDTGDIIMQEEVEIRDEDNVGDVHDRLMVLGGELVVKTVETVAFGNYQLKKQPELAEKPAPKIFKETCELDFAMSVEKVHNKVRGLSPYPGAWMIFRDWAPLKVFRTHVEKCQVKENAGEIVTDGKKMLKVACSDGYLWLDEVQAAGKRRMSAEEMMRGWH